MARIARTNWSLSNELKVAVELYFHSRGTDGALSAHNHAVMHKIPPHTFSKYVHKNPEKQRRKLGISQGRKMKMSTKNCEFLIQHTSCADRANEGFTQAHVIVNCQKFDKNMRQSSQELCAAYFQEEVGRPAQTPTCEDLKDYI